MTDDFRYHGARSPFLGPFVAGAVEGCGYTPSSPNCSSAEDLCIATACQASQSAPAGTVSTYMTPAEQTTFQNDFSTYMSQNSPNSPWKAFELWVTAIYEAEPFILTAFGYNQLAWMWNQVQESVANNTTSPWRDSACVNKMLNQWFENPFTVGTIEIGQPIYWYTGSTVLAEPYGGGTITDVNSQFPAQSNHGTTPPPCCYPDGTPLCGSDSDCCTGLACVSGTCVGCGNTGEVCCSGACASELLICQNNQCVDCGGSRQPCCANETCGAGSGLVCIGGTCQSPPAACGGNQQPCCSSSTCDPGYECVADSCQPCGQLNEYCCGGSCASGLECTSGKCVTPPVVCGNAAGEPCCAGNLCAQGLACDTSTGLCQVACGDNGEICCHGGTCNSGLSCVNNICTCGQEGAACCTTGTPCSAGLICQNGTCVGCGQQNEPCCNGGTPCGTDLVCKDGTCQCGYYAGPCCSDGSCGTGMVCSGGTCVYCGASGEQCCPGDTCAGTLTCQSGLCAAPPSSSTCNDHGACSTWCSGINFANCECVCCCYFSQYGGVPQSITDLNDYGRATGMQNADGTWTCPSGSGGCGTPSGGPTGTTDYWSVYEQAAQAALCSIDPRWCTASFDAIRTQVQTDCTIFVPSSGQQINPIRYAAQCVNGVWTGTCVAPTGIECQEGCSAPSPAPKPTCGGPGATCVAKQDCCGNIPCVQDTCLAQICAFDDCNYVAQASGGYVVVVHGQYLTPPSGSGSGNVWTSLTDAQNAWNGAKGCGTANPPPCTMDDCNYVGQVSGGYVVVINGQYLNPPSGSGSGNVWTSVTVAQTAFTDTEGCGGTVSICMPESGVCSGTSECCAGLTCSGGRCVQSVQCKPAGSTCQAASECCDLACVNGVCTTPPTTGCGTEGSPCCTTGTPCTQMGTICQNGFCNACGEVNTPCCAGNTCNTADLACINGACQTPTGSGGGCTADSQCPSGYICDTSSGTCIPCGMGAEPCCSGNFCAPGFVCANNQCVPCGGQNNPCCADNVCDTTYACVGGNCQPCGYVGELCCPGSLCITAGTTCDPSTGKCVQAPGGCGNTGASCVTSTDCCSGWGCYGGQCAPNTIQCGKSGATCVSDGDCCGGFACGGDGTCAAVSPPCGQGGATCSATSDCCNGFTCDPTTGTCTATGPTGESSALPIVLGLVALLGAGAVAVAVSQGQGQGGKM